MANVYVCFHNFYTQPYHGRSRWCYLFVQTIMEDGANDECFYVSRISSPNLVMGDQAMLSLRPDYYERWG